MSNLPISSKYRSAPERPVDEAEREQVTSQLNDAFAAGTISQDDYSSLLDQVFAARTLGELAPVVERAGSPTTYREPEIVAQRGGLPPGELAPAGMDSQGARTVALALTGVVGLMFLIGLVLLVFGV